MYIYVYTHICIHTIKIRKKNRLFCYAFVSSTLRTRGLFNWSNLINWLNLIDLYHRNSGERINKEKIVDNKDDWVNERKVLQDSCGKLKEK